MKIQKSLFGSRRSALKPWQSIVATLLHYANSCPPHWRSEFYALKSELMRRHGTFCGHDLQEIRKECWGPWERDDYGEYSPTKCLGENCPKCDGSGLFDVRWVRLERWEWCGFSFHCPSGDTRVPPEPGTHIAIHGLIAHPNYGRASQEAALWLLLLCGEWTMLWRALRSSRACGWQPWPFLTFQQIVMEASMKFSRKRCWCGRWYWTWGSGWQICQRCRKARETSSVPF